MNVPCVFVAFTFLFLKFAALPRLCYFGEEKAGENLSACAGDPASRDPAFDRNPPQPNGIYCKHRHPTCVKRRKQPLFYPVLQSPRECGERATLWLAASY
jgi:hypothetical protein